MFTLCIFEHLSTYCVAVTNACSSNSLAVCLISMFAFHGLRAIMISNLYISPK